MQSMNSRAYLSTDHNTILVFENRFLVTEPNMSLNFAMSGS